MDVIVSFRFNKLTGEVEVFDVDDIASTLTGEEHNRHHDGVTAEIGQSVVRNFRVAELTPAEARDTDTSPESDSQEREQARHEGERSRQR